MRKISFKIAAIAVFGLITFASCKKDADNTGIIATWLLSEVGEDTNNNDVIDSGETFTTTQENISGTLDLKSDNSYTYTFVVNDSTTTTSTLNGTYTFANNKLALQSQGQTDTVDVKSISNNKMVLKDENGDIEWLVFTK